MLRGTTVIVGTFTLVSAHAGAQVAAARPRTAVSATVTSGRASAPRIASIAPAPSVPFQPPAIPTTGLFTNIVSSPGLFANAPSFGQQVVPRPVSFFFVPALVMSDGRVFANFNGAYEEVLRQCPMIAGTADIGFVAPACWIVDSRGRYSVVQRR